MRTIDLALFADIVAARGAAVEAKLERARTGSVRRPSNGKLAEHFRKTVERLVESGMLSAADVRAERREVGELVAPLAAIRDLQAWAEAKLAEAQAEAGLDPGRQAEGEPDPYSPTRAA